MPKLRSLRTSHQGLPARATAVFLVVVALIAVTLAIVVRSSGSSLNSQVFKHGIPAGDEGVVVAVDGWSAAILRGVRLTYRPETATGFSDPARPLTPSPATSAEISALAKEQPQTLARIAARMVTVDPQLSCSTSGCDYSGHVVPLNDLRHPSRIPGYGPEYSGYHITDGVYIAAAVVPRGTLAISVSAKSYSSALLGLDGTQNGAPSVSGGSGDAHVVLSAGLGQLFLLNPAWVTKSPAAQDTELPPDTSAGTLSGPQAGITAASFSGGLAQPAQMASTLNSTELTEMTSPTTGCGPAVLCVPGKVHTTLSGLTTTNVSACTAGSSVKMRVVLADSRWVVHYTAPTAQFGIWSGKSPEQFANPWHGATASGLWDGSQPLVSGSVTERQSAAFVFTGTPPQLTALYGHSAQVGFDSSSDLAAPFNASVLARFGLHSC